MNKGRENARLPSDKCVLCEKRLEDVGGKRIIAQQLRGLMLSSKYMGGGNSDYPYQSCKLHDDEDLYLVVWGEKEKWTLPAIKRAKEEFLNGRRPWLCQICAHRKCSECGSPINYPMGSDILYDNGCSSHVAIFPFDPGCINPDCDKYREWGK